MSKKWSIFLNTTIYYPPEWRTYHWVESADTAMEVIRRIEKSHWLWSGEVTTINFDRNMWFIKNDWSSRARIEEYIEQ